MAKQDSFHLSLRLPVSQVAGALHRMRHLLARGGGRILHRSQSRPAWGAASGQAACASARGRVGLVVAPR